MIVDPKTQGGRLIMMAIGEKLAALQTVYEDPSLSKEEQQAAYASTEICRTLSDEFVAELNFDSTQHPTWITKGKSITQIIQELRTFEDQTLEVRLTFDGGQTNKPVSILTRRNSYAMIEYCGL